MEKEKEEQESHVMLGADCIVSESGAGSRGCIQGTLLCFGLFISFLPARSYL